MCAEKNNTEKKRTITCKWCEGMDKMISGCFPDDAGYSVCLARMNSNLGKSCGGQKAGDAAKGEKPGCCW